MTDFVRSFLGLWSIAQNALPLHGRSYTVGPGLESSRVLKIFWKRVCTGDFCCDFSAICLRFCELWWLFQGMHMLTMLVNKYGGQNFRNLHFYKYHEISFLPSYFKTVGEGRVLGFKPATFRQHTSALPTEMTLPRLYCVQFLKLFWSVFNSTKATIFSPIWARPSTKQCWVTWRSVFLLLTWHSSLGTSPNSKT